MSNDTQTPEASEPKAPKVTKRELEIQLAIATSELSMIYDRAKRVLATLRAQNQDDLGVSGKAALVAQIQVLEDLFGDSVL